MKEKKMKGLPEAAWREWGEQRFLPWYDRNKPSDITPPLDHWKQWGEEKYIPWYEGRVTAQSNPTDPPPPPPGPK